MSKWQRRLGWPAAFVVVAGAYLWLFGVHTFFALLARRAGRKAPIVNSVPVDLQDLSISAAKGEKLSYLGTDFEVPWDDLDRQKTRVVGHWVFLTFRSGLSMIVCINPPDEFIRGITKSKMPDPKLFTVLYGPDVLHSDYTLYKAIYETTPRQITLLTPSNRAVGLMMVILVKAIMPPTTDWAIFNVHSQEFKGFQLGDPLRRPQKMCVELISDDIELEITFTQNLKVPRPPITQAELNRIIQSVHKAPAATVPVKAASTTLKKTAA
jgi:hypothetical protein